MFKNKVRYLNNSALYYLIYLVFI